MKIYLRSKKDLKAVSHVLKTFYKFGTDIELLRLGGKEKEKLEDKIREIPEDDFSLVILGREDKKYIESPRGLETATRKLVFARTARVRNMRLSEIFNLIETSKFRFLLDISYDEALETYLLGKPGKLLGSQSFGDIYFVIWKDFLKALDLELPLGSLVHHFQDKERVFWENREILRIFRDIGDVVRFEDLENLEFENKDAIQRLLKANEDYLEQKLKVTLSKLRSVLEKLEPGSIVIPWSGGKDSTAVLLLAKLLKLDFVAVHVNTGCEFPQTEEYVHRVVEKLGVEFYVAEAPVCKNYRLLGEGYLRERRCTVDKITALYNFLERSFDDPLLLVGDRIAESKARSLRPELSRDKFWVYYPIKYWSYADVQLLMLKESLELNPLYSLGFYRIGCHVCPFLDSIEKRILEWMKKHALL
jgi:3'-phosphoadenosine 5'-phosphosulfate sulfotransferase (PAPS reductase)/FAD synthetase/3'-phosphoadenosine 5'-phosphosulfate sulfotransferase